MTRLEISTIVRDTISEHQIKMFFTNTLGYDVKDAHFVFPLEFWSVISHVKFQVGNREEVSTKVVTEEDAAKHFTPDDSKLSRIIPKFNESAHDLI
jgi:hypothetical protein